jgi:RimJ/RimL family protein N-acetyltransferase
MQITELAEHLYGPTERLLLRQLRATDVAAYRQLYQDPHSMRLVGPMLSTAEACASFYEALRQQDGIWNGTGVGPSLRIVIADRVGSVFLGLLAVDPWEPPCAVETGVLLLASACGKGYGLEALGALLLRLKTIGVERTRLCTDRRNEGMLRLAMRLGFEPDKATTADLNWVVYVHQSIADQ